ncbi:MAG: glycosyltransferase family 9 protein [Candidatus Aminicenantes bacterium]|nr:glycosyltransferase family 9 protein [Candidatus Aminicenantes bacterium]
MKFKTKLKLDRTVGTPALFLLNAVVLLVGIILRRDHSLKKTSIKKIAVQKIIGMGSIIEFSSSLQTLRFCFPQAKIIFISSIVNRQLLELYGDYIDDYVFIDDRSIFRLAFSSLKAVFKLIGKKIDIFFNLEVYSSFSTLISVFSLARNRFGFYLRSTAFRKGLDTHHIFYNQLKNIREIYGHMIERSGCPSINNKTLVAPPVPTESRSRVENFLHYHKITDFILININTSELSLERRWPEEYWIRLAPFLLENFGHSLLFSGSAEERDYVDSVIQKIDTNFPGKILNVAGEFNLKEFTFLIRKSILFITIDSGPYHLGASAEIKMVSLWGPENPYMYGLPKSGQTFLYRDVYCSPCVKQTDKPPCRGDNFCMKDITVEDVLAAVKSLLSSKN